MLLKSSLILLLLLNTVIKDFRVITGIFVFSILLNIITNKNLKENIKKTKIFFLVYLMTCILNIFFAREGKIILSIPIDFSVFNISIKKLIYITEEGIIRGTLLFLRLSTFIMISWIVTYKKLLMNKNGKYQKIILIVTEMLPESLTLIRKKMKLKSFIKHILKELENKYQ
ncbi:MAG: hypothetical protein LBT51_09485 [Fusobacteriaceae bacterium]|jgi:hypothetical protein|nr:hypothetical protein [Fusobacteriaceae bacterium]